jgi:uncharacterized protein (DUF1330 family)
MTGAGALTIFEPNKRRYGREPSDVDSELHDRYAYSPHDGKWREAHMSAYLIVQSTVADEPQYQKYREAVAPFIASFGGKIAARGAKVEILEGEHDKRSVVMFEFPTMDAIHAFWNSPDYVPIKKLRDGIATLNVWAFAGV